MKKNKCSKSPTGKHVRTRYGIKCVHCSIRLPNLTEEEKKEYRHKYAKTETFKKAVKKWRSTDHGQAIVKASEKKYRSSDKYRKQQREYRYEYNKGYVLTERYQKHRRMNTLRRGIKRWTFKLKNGMSDHDPAKNKTKVEIRMIIRDYKAELKILTKWIKDTPIKI